MLCETEDVSQKLSMWNPDCRKKWLKAGRRDDSGSSAEEPGAGNRMSQRDFRKRNPKRGQ